jgi:hypothetical protein
MAANPGVVGWRAEDEHYADENFGDPDQQIVGSGNLPLHSVSLASRYSAASSPLVTAVSTLSLLNQRDYGVRLCGVQGGTRVEPPARVCGPTKSGDDYV